jgi:hypothetical protein
MSCCCLVGDDWEAFNSSPTPSWNITLVLRGSLSLASRIDWGPVRDIVCDGGRFRRKRPWRSPF